jgi:hypothetical protein
MKSVAGREARIQQVAHRPVRKGSSKHDLPISASRREYVEILGIFATRYQVFRGGALARNLARRRNMVGSDVITQNEQRVCRV